MPARTGATKTKTKIAIVGFTPTRREAPWLDPTWRVWGINNLHVYVPEHVNADAWFDLHEQSLIRQDPQHVAWLRETCVPVYMWDPQDDFPSSRAYPKDEVLKRFGRRYFTNSISWMVALALLEGVEELAIVGVDMAQDSEYAAQRPSCEWIIGMAEGLGVKVYIPEASDLLKTSVLYGAEPDAMRAKLLDRKKDMEERYNELLAQHKQVEAALHQVTGALEDCNYWLGVWTQPQVARADDPTALAASDGAVR